MSGAGVPAPGAAIAEELAAWAGGLASNPPPAPVVAIARRQLLDVAGLCVAARHTPYVKALMDAEPGAGECTLIGHGGAGAAHSALVNGTAAHGEDFDDTFEGTPVHTGSVVVPAVLAACEDQHRSGADLLAGICAGVELMCRMALVTPVAIHRAGFHPTAVIGTLGATLGVGASLGCDTPTQASALGIAGSLAGGIIEYLAEGAWTKRLHAGWASHAGLRAVRFAQAGFVGPRTVMEGRHGFFNAFTNNDLAPDFSHLTKDLGNRWLMQELAFKPYACGTMAQPFIDCALALREAGVPLDAIESIECSVGEGTVHRLWEPLAEKHRPANAYAAKFSVPFCIAVAAVDGKAGLAQFDDARIGDACVLNLAARIRYRIDPQDGYPENYSGHLRVRLQNGDEREFRQPHLRGGRHAPLSDAEILTKYRHNARFGGWDPEHAEMARELLWDLFDNDYLDELSLLRQ